MGPLQNAEHKDQYCLTSFVLLPGKKNFFSWYFVISFVAATKSYRNRGQRHALTGIQWHGHRT